MLILEEDKEYILNDIAYLPFDLQLFASAEEEGRTEEPTEKKLRDAREKGQVAKTQELPQALVVIIGFLVVFFLGNWIFGKISKLVRFYLSNFSTFHVSYGNLRREGIRILIEVTSILMPIFISCVIAGIAGNMMQVGFQFTTHPLKVDFKKIKLNPAEMFKKIFFSGQVAMNLFKSLFKIGVVAALSYLIVMGDFQEVLKTPDISIALAMKSISIIGLKIIIWSSVLLLVLSIPDYFFQRKEFMDSLKMTKEELKQELKESMGDPHMRAYLKEMQRDILTRNMIKEVPKADVVVTNPTHFAVALKYESGSMEAPVVIAKGVDSIALKIREIAKENDILMVENRPLAHELYYNVEIGDIIPEELFKAVSEVYSILYKTRRMQAAI